MISISKILNKSIKNLIIFFIFSFFLRILEIENIVNEYWYSRQYREVAILLSMKKSKLKEANHVIRLDCYFMFKDCDRFNHNFFLAMDFYEVN